ncbi:hypothetical protein [Haloarcula hispanica pleomorphic virus 4]|uniref:Uncharacterized protein n=2 Tax=Betapleolipovirus TaxID=1911605 RepID=A0A2P0QED6_9VIRU|nr:putative protein 17 [Haloarcula hispanica pleomorphic virus 3]YP_009799439.1 hypothetical protein HOS97_gp08 [Haloarcula hispanica pleomorphic virus 4]ANW09678.1 putative protein 17 [Haloarcula hispanica pleomorphic virus 3]ARM71122.1 hypothetical protein [Haloarcula hispanica pleomorphic virus 4]
MSITEKISKLTEIKGVRVPMASSILTVYDPTSYAVIDYRVLRSLPKADPTLIDPNNYTKYAHWLLNYQNDEQIYEEYLNTVRNIATNQGITPREVDMGLWKYDKETVSP